MTTDDRRPTTTAGGRSSVVEPGTFFWNAVLVPLVKPPLSAYGEQNRIDAPECLRYNQTTLR
jgi:hypothetical protein